MENEYSEYAYCDEEEMYEGNQGKEFYSDRMELIQRTPWWVISIIFHTALLIMAAIWTVSQSGPEEEICIFEMATPVYERQEYIPEKRTAIHSSKYVKDEIIVEDPVISKVDLPIDRLETPDDMESELKARGRQEAMSTIELQGDGWDGVFGLTGLGSGAYGWRTGRGKIRALGTRGGGRPTELAVEAALRWFKRHQAADGSWSFGDYDKQCKLNPPCEKVCSGASSSGLEDSGKLNCATGFALLCFLGAGHTHKGGRYRQQVADGLSFLLAHQSDTGSFSKNNYAHSVATMAVAEAYGMTKTPMLKEITQKAVDTLLSRQKEYEGFDYQVNRGRNDTSVTGWVTMALKSAASSDIQVGNAFEGIANHMDHVTPEVKGDSYPTLAGHVAYTWKSSSNSLGHRNPRLTAIGMLCRVFIGQDTSSRMLRAHGYKMLENLPKPGKTDFYTMYYATLAMFQMGGEFWDKWNESMKNVLIDSQRKGGCMDGSWDPTGFAGWADSRAGRVFFTAVGCLSLEVYYRYLPVSMLKDKR